MSDKNKYITNEQFEHAMNEISLLRDKLDSKSCALIILSQELLECKAQRDQFKLMGEQLRQRYGQLRHQMEGLGPTLSSVYHLDADRQTQHNSEPLAQLLITLKEQNKHLIREIDDLRMKLEDAEGDLKIVRGQMRTMSQHIDSAAYESRDRNIDMNMITELEFFKNKVILLERDLQSVLDEKEELILSRDSYKLKVERLNHKLSQVMDSGTDTKSAADDTIVDIDSLFMENRFLKEKIKSFEDENRLLSLRLQKYKEILDKKRTDSSKNVINIKNALANTPLPEANVITARQIEELIATDALNSMEVTANNLSQLRNLVIALFDGLQDKSTSLSHAKKTNKILGKRVEELSEQLRAVRCKDRAPVLKTDSVDSNDSNTTTASNRDDPNDGTDITTTPDDLNDEEEEESDRRISDCERRGEDTESDDELPPQLNRLVKEAIDELNTKDINESTGLTTTTGLLRQRNEH